LGQPVAIYVSGESDGRFDGLDAVYFFGEKFRGPEMDQKYTDERVYWLDAGGVAGPRIPDLAADPLLDRTPPTDTPARLRAEVNLQWWTLHTLNLDTQDTWFWTRSQPLGPGTVITSSLPYTVPFPNPNSTATLRLEQISRVARWDLNPDHRTTIAVNGSGVLDQTWEGLRVRKVFTATLGAGVLSHGVNNMAVGTWNLPKVQSDDIYTNYWELDYRRQFKAYEGQFDFKAEAGGVQEYEITGWESGPVWVWNVSNPNAPVRLTLNASLPHRRYLPFVGLGGVVSATGAQAEAAIQAVRFRSDAPAGSRYWLQARATFNAPASVRLRPPTGLRSGGIRADTVLVAPAYLKAAAQPLAQWHEANGRRALIVDIQDVYDEFNEGIYHPKAIQAMMKWAAANWQHPAPQYLTLVGDGHWNFKGYNPAQYPPQPNPIPPYLVWADPWQGEVPADSRLGDINDDGTPEVAVGRLPVNTAAEAQVVIQKIINYNQGTRTAPWQKRALFVADNTDSGGDFRAVSDEIITKTLPLDITPVRAYLPGTYLVNPAQPATSAEIAQTHQVISSTLQSGALMVQFAGHGATFRWTHELVWQAKDVAGLRNGSMLPLVMTFNCLDGYYAHPDPTQTALAELMLQHSGGGSIGAISPTGLGVTDSQHAFRTMLMNVMFKDNVREMGRALALTKQQFYQKYGAHYLIDTMTFFGDPALRLPAQGGQ
jgi:hypothetical protein